MGVFYRIFASVSRKRLQEKNFRLRSVTGAGKKSKRVEQYRKELEQRA